MVDDYAGREARRWSRLFKETGAGAGLGNSAELRRSAQGLQPALERLSALLRRRGIAVPVSALAALLAGGRAATASAAVLAQRALESAPTAAAGGSVMAARWFAAALPCRRSRCRLDVWRSRSGVVGGRIARSEQQRRAAAHQPLLPQRTAAALTSMPFSARCAAWKRQATILPLSRNSRRACGYAPEAVAPVVQVLHTRRWGPDTQRVAQACFHRWAQFDIDAAWRDLFSPDFLGAATKTVFADLDALPPGNPERLVAMFNDLPQATASSGFGHICLHRRAARH